MTDAFFALSPNQQKAALIALVFTLYLTTILVFGVIYFLVFRKNPSTFVFATSIVEQQRRVLLEESEAEISKLSAAELTLGSVVEVIEKLPPTSLKRDIWKMQTDYGTLRYVCLWRSMGRASGYVPYIRVEGTPADVQSPQILIQHIASAGSPAKDFSYDTVLLLSDIKKVRTLIARKLARSEKMHAAYLNRETSIWSVWDFVYFSVVIQSTVGLGDIQPNSTRVRAIVVGQILLGYAILVVVLNITIGWQF
jgi:hypothetical protein